MDKFANIIKKMQGDIEALQRQATLKNITLPADGKFVPPSVTSDPSSPPDGSLWYRSDLDVHKVRQNGITKTLVVS